MLKRGDTLTAVDSQARVLNSVKNANVDGIPVIEVKDIDASLKNRSVKEALTILARCRNRCVSPLPRSPLRRRIR